MRWQTPLLILAPLFASLLALADNVKTVNGQEYKNVDVSRVEPDGIVLKTKWGISKVYFNELPKEVQERFHYNPENAAKYSAQQNAALNQLREKQQFPVAAQTATPKQAISAGPIVTFSATPVPHVQSPTSLQDGFTM